MNIVDNQTAVEKIVKVRRGGDEKRAKALEADLFFDFINYLANTQGIPLEVQARAEEVLRGYEPSNWLKPPEFEKL